MTNRKEALAEVERKLEVAGNAVLFAQHSALAKAGKARK